jgi:peroxiredoxin
MIRTGRLAALVGVMAAMLTAGIAYGELKLGDPAPKWSGLSGTDDVQHGLSDYAGAEVLVVVFTCNNCPVAQAYQDRLIALQKDYQPKGVQVVAIDVNKTEGLAEMKERAKEKDYNFPYLYDATQKSARDHGATTTPHVFLFDKDRKDRARKLVYVGGIDDQMNESKVEQHYLRDALDAVLAGKVPAKQKTAHPGCGIKWK